MIAIQARIHDTFSVEMKVRFSSRNTWEESEFDINTWMFLTNSLDVNPGTYSKEQFYSDVKSNVRFTTPTFILKDIASENSIPFQNLLLAIDHLNTSPVEDMILEYEYQLKMFMAILRSAIRDAVDQIQESSLEEDIALLCRNYIHHIRIIRHRFRALHPGQVLSFGTEEAINYYTFSDEFMSSCILQFTYELYGAVDSGLGNQNLSAELLDLIKEEKVYLKESDILTIEKDDSSVNQKVVYRQALLNKYIETDLYLDSDKRKDGLVVEQIYYSIAAGISMIFATIVAFTFQQKYGNFTMPLFVALVVGYMLKDRIKELMRFYFASKLGGKYFDNKNYISVKDRKIGWIKEGVDFITEDKVPEEVVNLRNRSALLEIENRIHNEKILLYRKKVRIDRSKMNLIGSYDFTGVNDTVRFNITRICQRMGSPDIPVFALSEQEDGTVKPDLISADRIYYLNFIVQIKQQDRLDYKRFRLVCQRTGILKIEEL